MSVIFLATDLESLIRFRLVIILHLAKLNDEVYLISHRNINIDNYLLPPNIKLIDIPDIRGIKNIWEEYKHFRQIRKLIHITPATIILAYGIKASIMANFLHRDRAKHSISIITGLGSAILSFIFRWPTIFLLRHSLKNCTQVMTLNQDDTHFLLKKKLIKKNQLLRLPGEGVDTQFYYQAPIFQQTFVFLFIGRLIKHKGIFEFIEAAKAIQKTFPNVHFQILGNIDRKNPSALNTAHLRDIQASNIHYLGYQMDVRPFILQATCIVLPSYGEGLSRALLEAMAMGRPIISTNISGCRELIEEGKNGYLCKVRSTPSLIEALEKMLCLKNNDLTTMGEYSRQIVLAKYSSEYVIKKYESLFSRLSP